MGLGSMMILPFFLWEIAQGGRISGGLPVWLAMAYIAVFPSFIAYLFFNRGIELVGAARAGQSWHLMPLFGGILAVLFLGETFYLYHVIGVALIAAGILIASLKSAPARRPVIDRNRT
jgi:drug/metabolite transporter (DMT)-like permease